MSAAFFSKNLDSSPKSATKNGCFDYFDKLSNRFCTHFYPQLSPFIYLKNKSLTPS